MYNFFVPYFSYIVKIPVHCIALLSISLYLICANKDNYIYNNNTFSYN